MDQELSAPRRVCNVPKKTSCSYLDIFHIIYTDPPHPITPKPTTIMPPSIPIIDIASLKTPTSPSSRLSTAKSLVTACQQVGFAYITNHNLPPTLLEAAFRTSKALFALPHDAKMQAPHPAGPEIHRGYSHPGQEKVSQYTGGREDIGEELRGVVDCKESYEIGSEDNAEQPNVWLPEETLPGFREGMLEFYWRCNEVAQVVLRALALGIGLKDVKVLTGRHSGLNNQLRLLRYPPVAAVELESGRAARMPAHSDWSSITLLFQDECGGLEVEDPHRPGEFMPVTPIEGACVVNVGDLLMRWSNGKGAAIA
jgi:isopenicillin N synthase-like dioxygenase